METGNETRHSNGLSAVRRDINQINDRVELVNNKVEVLHQGLDPVPQRMGDLENNWTARSSQLEGLEQRNKVHSARLKLLQKEMEHVKLENDMMWGQMKNKGELGDGYNPGESPRKHDDTHIKTHDDHERPVERGPSSPRKESYYNGYGSKALNDTQDDEPQKAGIKDPRKPQLTYEEMQKLKRKEVYSVYDSTAINPQNFEQTPKHRKYPWFDHETHPHAGGFLFIRFDDSAYYEAKNSLKQISPVCRVAGGYMMGIARKDKIILYENAPSRQHNWYISRKQDYKDVTQTENAIAAFWFTTNEAAQKFFHHGNRGSRGNPWREPCFPSANGYDAYFVPLQTAPSAKPLNSYLFVEFLDGRNYDTESMTQFEAEVRHDMSRVLPGCRPMVVSAMAGIEVFKPGVFISPRSKLFISMFEKLSDIDKIWKLGMIQGLRHKWNMNGSINVFSMCIEEAY